MSDTVLIAIVIGVVVMVIVLLLRGRLSGWDASWKGIKTRLTAHAAPPEADTLVSRNRQSGAGNEIDLEGEAAVKENTQRGKRNKIKIRSGKARTP